ncbi:MAG: phosphoenolpyruvate carboxykinase (ATP) [Deltaproteobacteria bacterium]|nr:phosphoenolpyruvate carboxykinase (ATP) [Deltaproteobacteria bacterium]MBW2017343.1 phosphoenolpyruvate carboxykinase (ATP) [Deltaproteobacteria bacterium]MBW2303988.1 phosphoenolpyruvate carboxykinase (ATP) [Deltaproteobacteria bacterium]
MTDQRNVRDELEAIGFKNVGNVYWNATTPHLYEEIVRRREGQIAHLGPVVVRTGHHMGRSPNDRFIVREPSSLDNIWWGDVNRGIEESRFMNLFYRLQAYFQNKDVFIQDCYAGAAEKYRIPIRVITETAWHNLFARNMFIQMKNPEEVKTHVPEFTVVNVPRFHAVPELDGTSSEAFVLLHLGKKLVLIGGTSYAGEIKKSVFSMLNYILPRESVLSMHCSANLGKNGDTAVFFGLSGTGKTTLSADPHRYLIGDDEHGWSEDGIFNFEGGCYAKVIRLSREAEPEIYECTRRFGTILENVTMDNETRRLDLDDNSLTENTRAAYPISHIPSARRDGVGGHPSNVVMLTCDAFGVMPPVAKLTPEQAVYHFLSGYTAKVAGTEIGVKEPKATFSACFGAPFMVLPPTVYADLFMKKIRTHKVDCWLLNTGWVGEPYGKGDRIKIAYSRALIKSVLEGKLADVEYEKDPLFGFMVPKSCEGVPPEVLNPRTSTSNRAEYEERAKKLAQDFKDNFKQFKDGVQQAVLDSMP